MAHRRRQLSIRALLVPCLHRALLGSAHLRARHDDARKALFRRVGSLRLRGPRVSIAALRGAVRRYPSPQRREPPPQRRRPPKAPGDGPPPRGGVSQAGHPGERPAGRPAPRLSRGLRGGQSGSPLEAAPRRAHVLSLSGVRRRARALNLPLVRAVGARGGHVGDGGARRGVVCARRRDQRGHRDRLVRTRPLVSGPRRWGVQTRGQNRGAPRRPRPLAPLRPRGRRHHRRPRRQRRRDPARRKALYVRARRDARRALVRGERRCDVRIAGRQAHGHPGPPGARARQRILG